MNMLLDQELSEKSARIEAGYQNQSAWIAATEQWEEDKAAAMAERAAIIVEAIRNARIARAVLMTASQRSKAEAYQANAIVMRALDKITVLLMELH